MSSEAPTEAAAAIEARRERGDDQFDPVRFRFIESLSRRAGAHGGAARRTLDDKVVKLLAAYDDDRARAASCAGEAAPRGTAPRPSALAELAAYVRRHSSSSPDGELKALSRFRSTWARLSTDRRLTQSLAKVPENAGPLNSHQLVHRSLTLMRDLSPEYLDRFMSYVDTLLWLDRAHGAGTAPAADSPRAEGRRKASRGRPG